MSTKPPKTMTAPTAQLTNLASWREEIEAFCQHTLAHLQEFVGSLDVLESDPPPLASTNESRPPTTKGVPPSATPPTLSREPESTQTPRDLDTSQDRLANLKRELAAKLSDASRDTTSKPR